VHPHLLRPRAQDFRQKRTALRLNLEDTMREVEKYTQADQQRLAKAAIKRLPDKC
jgi:hypothetical protein